MITQLKRYLGVLIAAALCLGSMAACAEQSPTRPGEAMQAYQNVILGRTSYIRCNQMDNQDMEGKFGTKITEWYGYSFDKPLHYKRFCVTDLDADGLPELIISLSDDFGFELLRYEGGTVYGFPFVARGMEDVTLNGNIAGSNGAMDNGWYTVRFSKNRYQTNETCWERENGDQVEYQIAGKQVTKSEYSAFLKKIDQQKRPLWLTFNQKTLNAVVQKFQSAVK